MKRILFYTGLSLLSGLLLSLSWPAHGIPFLLFFAFIPLLYIEDQLTGSRRKGWKFFGYSYLAMVTWNLATTWWIYNSSPEGAYMAILANSLFMAVVLRLFQKTKAVFGNKLGYIALVLYWVSFEFLHLDWDLSWPWLMLGNGFANFVHFIQWYEFTGVLGGTIWVLVMNILLYLLMKKVKQGSLPKKTALAVILLLIVPVTYSLVRYFSYTEKEDPVHIVLVQPNIDPWRKFDVIPAADQVNRLLSLANQKITSETDYVICPETAIPVPIFDHELKSHKYIREIQGFVNLYPHVKFITGITHLYLFDAGEKIPISAEKYGEDRYIDDHNAAIQIDRDTNYQLYYKSKLVPGPEMLPFAYIFKPIQKQLFGNLGGQIGNLGTQKERSVFSNADNNAKAAPVLCYESIYGAFMTGYVRNGANFISVSTNDAWWGDTPGYKQLLAYARLRAIECRRSIARSANTGISCFINQRGDILQPTQYLETTSIAGTINLNSSMTLYARLGDYLGSISLLGGALILLYSFIKGFLKKRAAKANSVPKT